MAMPEIELEVGPKTLQPPLFNEDHTVVHLRLEEAIEITKEPCTIVFDVTIRNPDGYFGIGTVSSLCHIPISGSVFSSHLSVFQPSIVMYLPPSGKECGPVKLEAGTPVFKYKYYECLYDECGHDTCEPRNQLRFSRRWTKMTEEQKTTWRNRLRRVRCSYKFGNPDPFRDVLDENIVHLRAERDMVLLPGCSALAYFDVDIEIPFGRHAVCTVSELCDFKDLLAGTETKLWDSTSSPVLEMKLIDGVKEEVHVKKGDVLCRVEMKKHACGCPKCYLLQNEPTSKRPNHPIDFDPNY